MRAALEANRHALALCDIGLPGMNGCGVAKTLRRNRDGKTKPVAISGYAQADDVKKSVDPGSTRTSRSRLTPLHRTAVHRRWLSSCPLMSRATKAAQLLDVVQSERPAAYGKRSYGAFGASGSASGIRTVNVLPRSLPGLRASTVPPCRFTSFFTRLKPMPSPP